MTIIIIIITIIIMFMMTHSLTYTAGSRLVCSTNPFHHTVSLPHRRTHFAHSLMHIGFLLLVGFGFSFVLILFLMIF